MVDNVDDDGKLCHFCLGHTNYGSLRCTSFLGLAEGFPQIEPPSGVCEGCVMGKGVSISYKPGTPYLSSKKVFS